MWNVSGISGAAPVWLEVMNYLHREVRSNPPARPAGVVVARTAFRQAGEAQHDELFLAGTEPPPVGELAAASEAVAMPRIAYPPDGTVIVIDPEIPQEHQRVFFEAENAAGVDARWQLNGELLPSGEAGRRWQPLPGRYRLCLIDSAGEIRDTVSFDVRGGKGGQER